MRKRIWALPLFLLLLSLPGCNLRSKVLDRRVTLKRRDRIPYGTKIAYDGLSYLFPNATISYSEKPPSSLQSGEGKKACIIVVTSMDPSPSDIGAILDFVGEGNHVFISARRFGDSLLHTLGVKAGFGMPVYGDPDSLRLSIHHPVTGDSLSFAYPGDSYDGWINSFDPTYTTVLGRDHLGRPDFVRFNYKGGGSLYLHFAPLAFSNFFLLHKNNRAYYEDALSYLPQTVQEVVWDGYFVYGRPKGFSALQYILGSRAAGLGFLAAAAVVPAGIYLFESKRRQRPIPVIQALQNTSLDFVRTIGRLYFQRRDNHNLAVKMVTHFQDQVRTRYNLAATALDERLCDTAFLQDRVSAGSLSRLVGYMRELPSKAYVPDAELMDFHRQLEAFYKIA
jgi:hypothetical protein